MGVLHASFGAKIWPKSFGCVAIGSAGLFMFSSYIMQGLE